jgi:hypothetical protein
VAAKTRERDGGMEGKWISFRQPQEAVQIRHDTGARTSWKAHGLDGSFWPFCGPNTTPFLLAREKPDFTTCHGAIRVGKESAGGRQRAMADIVRSR